MEIQKLKKRQPKSNVIENTSMFNTPSNPNLDLEVEGGWWIPDTSPTPDPVSELSKETNSVGKNETEAVVTTSFSDLKGLDSEILDIKNVNDKVENVINTEPVEIYTQKFDKIKVLDQEPFGNDSAFSSFKDKWSSWKSGSKVYNELPHSSKSEHRSRNSKLSITGICSSGILAWNKFENAFFRSNSSKLFNEDLEVELKKNYWKRLNALKHPLRQTNKTKIMRMSSTKSILLSNFCQEFNGITVHLNTYKGLKKTDMTKYNSFKEYSKLNDQIRANARIIMHLFKKLKEKRLTLIIFGWKEKDKRKFLKTSKKVKEELEKFIDNANQLWAIVELTSSGPNDREFFGEKMGKILRLASAMTTMHYLNLDKILKGFILPDTALFEKELEDTKNLLSNNSEQSYPIGSTNSKGRNKISEDFCEIWFSEGCQGIGEEHVSTSEFALQEMLDTSTPISKPEEAAVDPLPTISSVNYIPVRPKDQIKLETTWSELMKMISSDNENKTNIQETLKNAVQTQLDSKRINTIFPLANSKEDFKIYFTRSEPVSHSSVSTTGCMSAQNIKYQYLMNSKVFVSQYSSKIPHSTTIGNVLAELRHWSWKKMEPLRYIAQKFRKF